MGVEVVNYIVNPTDISTQPEPFKKHLTDISELVVKEKADLGLLLIQT
jgi:phosphomannomutase